MDKSRKLAAVIISSFMLFSLVSCNGYSDNAYGRTINTNRGSADGGRRTDTNNKSQNNSKDGSFMDNFDMGFDTNNGIGTQNNGTGNMGTGYNAGASNPNYFA